MANTRLSGTEKAAAADSVEGVFDFVVVGSGFGGSVSAMRLTEKGYRVIVLERGKRFRDQDFAVTNWEIWKYLWAPVLRCFGILQISFLKGVMILHGAGVGGGSLGYANVLEVPDDHLFESPAWKHLADWKTVLEPHYETARHMLGVTPNPDLWPADHVLRTIAEDMQKQATFRTTEVGVFFGPDGAQVDDPYFGGEGPPRRACTHCGGCMVGCRHNAKNTLEKNYLYFAEKRGAAIRPEAEVTSIHLLESTAGDGARYEVRYSHPAAWFTRSERRVRARNVVLSAGVLGTLKLLFHCRDVSRSLPALSPRLGDRVRTNGQGLMGVISRNHETNYSKGIAITSIFEPDELTRVEPVRYPEGSSLMRLIGAPLIEAGDSVFLRVVRSIGQIVSHPVDFLRIHILPAWARRTTILLVMQKADTHMRLRLARSPFAFFRRALVAERNTEHAVPAHIDIGHWITRQFATRIDGIPAGSVAENLFNMPTTAHVLGGCPMGENDAEGVVDVGCQVHNYAGLYVVDGSVVPANPGVNPSLTITALAEYAMSRIPRKG